MITDIRDESELPAPPILPDKAAEIYYIRSQYEPSVVIAGPYGGACFRRRDGAPWEHPAYKVSVDERGKVTRRPASTYADSKRYPPSAVKSAA